MDLLAIELLSELARYLDRPSLCALRTTNRAWSCIALPLLFAQLHVRLVNSTMEDFVDFLEMSPMISETILSLRLDGLRRLAPRTNSQARTSFCGNTFIRLLKTLPRATCLCISHLQLISPGSITYLHPVPLLVGFSSIRSTQLDTSPYDLLRYITPVGIILWTMESRIRMAPSNAPTIRISAVHISFDLLSRDHENMPPLFIQIKDFTCDGLTRQTLPWLLEILVLNKDTLRTLVIRFAPNQTSG